MPRYKDSPEVRVAKKERKEKLREFLSLLEVEDMSDLRSVFKEMVGEVLSLMKELAQGGLTMVVVTHEIGFAREVASRVLFMDKGKIVEEGPPDRVIDRPANPRLQEFFSKVL